MSYHHLSRRERKKIANMHRIKFSVRRIAGILGRSPSTVSREIRRNSENGRYRSPVAEEKYQKRRLLCKPRGKLSHDELEEYIRGKLLQAWSPEQIAGRLPLDYPRRLDMRVSHSSIYRWLHQEWLQQAAVLQFHLRHHGHRHGEKRGKFNGVRELKERSRLALRRKRLGDWEVDTIVSSHRSHQECLLSVCDRKSRYCGLVLLRRRNASEVMRGFHFLFDSKELPLETMAGDRGTEFACYKEVESCWNVPFYFARPHSPWQKPSVENQNGLVRLFFPKGTNFHEISSEQVAAVMHSLNNRPRKCLAFKTPTEVLLLT